MALLYALGERGGFLQKQKTYQELAHLNDRRALVKHHRHRLSVVYILFVSGSATANTKADKVIVSLGVETTDKTAEKR